MVGTRQFDEDAVFSAVLGVFALKGFAGATMGDLASAAGVQRGSLYNAYGSKEALWHLAYGRYRKAQLAQFAAALDTPDVGEALRAVLTVAIASMRRQAGGCLTTRLAAEGGASPEFDAELLALLDGLEALLADRLRDAAGLALPAEATARLVVTFTRGLAVMDRLRDDPDRLREDADALLALLVPARPAST